MRKVGLIIDRLSYIGGYIAGWATIGIMTLTMAEVLTRYILHNPIILADEFGGYSLVFITFFGLAYCWMQRGHIRVTFAVERVPAKYSNWLRVATIAIALIYIGVATFVSFQFILDAFQRGIKSNSWLMVPLQWPEMAIPIGFLLFFLVLLFDLMKTIKDIRAGVGIEAGYKKQADEGGV